MVIRLSPEDHDRVTAAVAAAEAGTDGEIVTIVAPASDRYADVPLHWALLTLFLGLAIFAAFPALLLWVHGLLMAGWGQDAPLAEHLTVLMVVLALKFMAARLIVGLWPVRLALTPGATKARRVRRRAIELFRITAEQRTRRATAVLLYLSLAEHRAELIGDSAINAKITPDMWADAMAALLAGTRDGRVADGMVEAIGLIGGVLHAHFPRAADDRNELPDRLIEL